MKIYIDAEYICHVKAADGRRAVETEAFDGKCAEYIEGFRYVPAGETWTREDGEVFYGEMITPWKDLAQLEQCQTIYERMLAAQTDMQAALDAIYAGVTE